MGVKTYWLILAAILVAGMILPQEGKKKIYYIGLMTAIHIFFCGFRYMFLVGDLHLYWRTFNNAGINGFFDPSVFMGGRNFGFFWLMKIVYAFSHGNYQVFLIVLAVITQIATAILIYRYSTKPWLSYMVWDCMSFYLTYDYCAIKQGTAMAFLMFAFIFIRENKPKWFYIFVLIAGTIHAPALCFLPAYYISDRKINTNTLIIYAFIAVFIMAFRNQFVNFFADTYYGEQEEAHYYMESARLGGRFFIIVMMLLAGLLLRGFENRQFTQLFNLIIIAAILQMYSDFDNVFTRLCDYYLQFTILYLPMTFFQEVHDDYTFQSGNKAIFPFTQDSLRVFATIMVFVLIWFYWRTCLGYTITGPDNFLDYRFMWSVH